MLRIPAAGRIEDRTVDGSCNPYLAATAMLAAGLDGIERGLDPGEPNSANLYELSASERASQGIEVLPANLLDATRELERNDVLRAALGKTRDGDYLDYYVKVKQREVQAATSRSRSGSSSATCSCSDPRVERRGVPRQLSLTLRPFTSARTAPGGRGG